MHLCSAKIIRHHDTAGHSVKCSPTAGTFRLHRRTAPTNLIDFTTAITSIIFAVAFPIIFIVLRVVTNGFSNGNGGRFFVSRP